MKREHIQVPKLFRRVTPLAAACVRSNRVYRLAAATITDGDIRRVLLRYAQQRNADQQQILTLVRGHSGQPVGDVGRSLTPRRVMSLRNIAGTSGVQRDKQLIYRCEQEEFRTINTYDHLLAQLSLMQILRAEVPKTADLIRIQRESLHRAWEHLLELQKLYE